MSHIEFEDQIEDLDAKPSSSLAARMAQRTETLEKHQTEKFPVPGYEDILAVELRSLGFGAMQRVVSRNQKIRDEGTRNLYTMADQIAQATIGFHEIFETENGQEMRPLPEQTWSEIAQMVPNHPQEMTERQAVLLVVSDKRIPFLVNDWGVWTRTVTEDIDREVVRDFGQTG